MKKSGLQTFRIIIFFLGLLIIFAAGILLHDSDTELSWQEVYILITVVITYIIMFIPTIMPIGDDDKSGGIFAAGAVYYRGAIGYLLSTLGLIFLVTKVNIALPHAVISELVAIFVFVIYVYFACLVSSKVSEVAREESNKRYGIDQLRKAANRLVTVSENLGIEHQGIKNRICKIGEDIRYISPSNDREASDLEARLFAKIRELSADSFFANPANVSSGHTDESLSEIEAMIKMRKNIY